MSDLLILDWSRDVLRALVVPEGGRGAAHAAATLRSLDHADPQVPVVQAAEELRAWLSREGISAQRTLVVVPREAVVVRRLQLPQAPPDELPDLVRFQAATRTSSPMESLSLDFLPLPVSDQSQGQDVVSITMERDALARIENVCRGAGLSLDQVTTSPLTVAELVRNQGVSDLGMGHTDLIVFQLDQRIELSVVEAGTLVFSHAGQVPPAAEGVQQAERLKPLKSDLARTIVSLGQTDSDARISRCIYVCGSPDAAVQAFLEERFPQGVLVKNAAALLTGKNVSGYEALAGAALPRRDDHLRIDLLHPRRRREVPDRRKLYYGVAAAVALLALGLGYSVFYSKKSALEGSIQALQNDTNSRLELLKKGKPRADAYQRIARWKESDSDPVELWNQLRTQLTGTDRVYFVELRVIPLAGDMQARFVGRGHARGRGDVDALNQTLSDHGFRVRPTTATQGSRDPDYPWEFDLDVELPRSHAAAPTVATGSSASASPLATR